MYTYIKERVNLIFAESTLVETSEGAQRVKTMGRRGGGENARDSHNDPV